MKIRSRKSIATKLILVVLGLYSLVALVGTGSHFFLEYRYQKALIIRDLSDIQRAFEGAVADSLWKMDQQALKTVVLGMLRIPKVIGIRISDADGRLTAIGGTVLEGERIEKRDVQVNLLGLGTEDPSAVAAKFGLRLFTHSFALKQKGPTGDFDLGKVTIYSSNLFIYRQLKLELFFLVLNVIFTFVTFSIALLWAVRRYLGRPLGELMQATENVDLENLVSFSAAIDAPEGSELKVFENAFNTMVRNLDHTLSLHRQAENDLRESKERYELAMNAARDGLWDWDLTTNDIYYSPGWKRMLGYDYDELPNDFSVWEKLTAPEDVKRAWEMQQEVIEKKRDRFEIEFKMQHKDGHWVDILSRSDVIFNPDGQAIRIVGTHVDVTERNRVAKALQENEKFLETVVENIPNMIFVKDAEELRFVRLNRAGEELLGFSRNEMVGKNDHDFFPKKEAEFFTGKDREVLNQGGVCDIPEEPIQTKYKGERILHTKKIPILDENGLPKYLLGISEDITERKRAEEALEKRMVALTRPLDDSEGITFEELFNLDNLQRLQDQFAEATGVASIITDIDGTPITRPSNFCRLCNDIIRKTEKGMANCFKSDAELGKWNPDGPTIQPCLSGGLWDAGAGISIGGRHIANWLIGQVRDETQTDEKMRVYASRIGADEEAVIEAFREVPAMSREQFEVVSQALFTLANQLSDISYQNIQQARFIGEKQRAEEEKEKLENQLLQAQKMEAVGRLAGGVAHDFNNMLSVILGNTEMALDQVDNDQPLHANLKEIKNAAQRSADMTRQLLAFARKQTIAPKVLDLNKIVNNMLKMLQRLIGEDIDLVWLPGKKLWPVRVDPSQIDQIIANLSVNARDAISGVGKLTIETGKATFDKAYCEDHPGFLPGDFVLLAVSDNGCGMEKGTLDNLFEPFYTTKDIDKGTGLGLATVYGIIKQNDGFINVYSEPNEGTTFKIYLPRHATVGEQVLKKVTVQPDSLGNETILLVEDEPAILNMTAMMLERLGYIVLTASTPGKAIRMAREHGGDIHLLMTDVVMPEMNGRDLARNLLKIYPNLKRLFMSGYTANVIAHHGVLDEGVNFIQKPFSKKGLSVKLREVLGDGK